MPRASTDHDEMITGVNVTPLVDIVLVLLVVLMATAAYVTTLSIPIDLPGQSEGAEARPAITIGVAADGALTVDGEAVDREAMKQRLHAFALDDPEARAILRGDAGASHGAIVSVLDVLRHEHITRIAFQAPAP